MECMGSSIVTWTNEDLERIPFRFRKAAIQRLVDMRNESVKVRRDAIKMRGMNWVKDNSKYVEDDVHKDC